MNLDLIKKLRERTGAGIVDCKKALVEANDDIEKAVEILRERGIAKAVKKAGRATDQGIITAYIHPGAQLGVLVELNCETDFVARTDEFKSLANEIALQIAATDPDYITRTDVPEDVLNKEREIYRKQFEGQKKPESVIEKIVDGKVESFYKEHCLLDLPYIRDEKKTMQDIIKEHISRFGENISVRRFARFKVGEE